MSMLRSIWLFKKTIVLILAPLVFMPLPIIHPIPEAKCAYGILVMATYWVTEAIPIAATALMPVVIFPWLGVISSKQICPNYLKDTNMLFVGGLLVAVAVEKWNLHKRIALRVLMLVGSKPRWLMFGFMVTTAFLSMWISNTATTAMMIPIAQAVLDELGQHNRMRDDDIIDPESAEDINSPDSQTDPANVENVGDSNAPGATGGLTSKIHPEDDLDVIEITPNGESDMTSGQKDPTETTPLKFGNKVKSYERYLESCKAIKLSIAYAANIGGTATITGTPPNMVFKGQVDTLFGGDSGINFSSWFIFAFPNMLLSLFLAWLWLQFMFLGPRELIPCLRRKEPEDDSANKVIRREYEKMGPMTFAEVAVLIHFIVLAVLWLTREPEFIPGWGSLLSHDYVTDACVAITIGVLLFMFPSRWPNAFCFRKKSDITEPAPAPSLLDWPTVHSQLAWGVVLVLGGGFAIADACKESGLSAMIGDAFKAFGGIPVWALILLLCTITAVFTEVTSNVATATIFLPILAELAKSLVINPLYLMIPVTIATSFAFMLPVATPPNAIVFAYGQMRIIDMVKAGWFMNVVCILVLQIAINTWGFSYFNLGEFPDWAKDPGTELPGNFSLAQNITG